MVAFPMSSWIILLLTLSFSLSNEYNNLGQGTNHQGFFTLRWMLLEGRDYKIHHSTYPVNQCFRTQHVYVSTNFMSEKFSSSLSTSGIKMMWWAWHSSPFWISTVHEIPEKNSSTFTFSKFHYISFTRMLCMENGDANSFAKSWIGCDYVVLYNDISPML